MTKFFLSTILFLLLTPTWAADNTSNSADQALKKMHWFKHTIITLPQSNAKLSIPNDYIALSGKDANDLDAMINGKGRPVLEGITISNDEKYLVDFENVSDGYVDASDFSSLDASALMDETVKNTEKHNEVLKAAKMSLLHVTGWMQQPTYDPATHTAYWAIRGSEEGGDDLVNQVALRLGRSGYERFTLVSSVADYKPIGGPLDLMLRSFSFAPGNTYADHVSTDKAAGYGLAGLIGAIVGVKAVKVAAAGGLAVFFKPLIAFFAAVGAKLWVLILAPFIWIKSLFKKKVSVQPVEPALLTHEDHTKE